MYSPSMLMLIYTFANFKDGQVGKVEKAETMMRVECVFRPVNMQFDDQNDLIWYLSSLHWLFYCFFRSFQYQWSIFQVNLPIPLMSSFCFVYLQKGSTFQLRDFQEVRSIRKQSSQPLPYLTHVLVFVLVFKIQIMSQLSVNCVR